MQSSATSASRAHHPTLWEGSPSYSMVMKWAAQFKRGRETRLKNYPLTRSMTNQQITQGHIEMDISCAVIHNEVHVSPHWVQKLLLASWLHHFQPEMEEQWKHPERKTNWWGLQANWWPPKPVWIVTLLQWSLETARRRFSVGSWEKECSSTRRFLFRKRCNTSGDLRTQF